MSPLLHFPAAAVTGMHFPTSGTCLPRDCESLEWSELVREYERVAPLESRTTVVTLMQHDLIRTQRFLNVYKGDERIGGFATPLFQHWTPATVGAVIARLCEELPSGRASELAIARTHIGRTDYIAVRDASGWRTVLLDVYTTRGPLDDRLPAATCRYLFSKARKGPARVLNVQRRADE